MNYYTYLDNIPPISPRLINEALNVIGNTASIFVNPKFDTYQVYPLGGEIGEFTKSIFDFRHSVSIQVIKDGVPVHIDIGRRVAFNYLIDVGGDNVLTSYFNINDFQEVGPNRRLFPKNYPPAPVPFYSVCLEQAKWHKLNVSIPHSVLNIKRPRIAITVSPIEHEYKQRDGILRRRLKLK